MASIGYATLSVIPSAAGFHSALSRDITPGLSGVGRSAGKVLGAGLLIGAAAVVAGIGAVLKTGFDEAKDASAGMAQLAAGIKSTGNAANVTIPGMEALASRIQAYSGQTDDSIVKTEQLLLTFTNIKNVGADNIFDQTTVAAADMAAKMGGDASASAIRLGRALSDPAKGVTALTRVGVVFTAAQKDQIAAMVKTGDTIGAQKVILAELNKEFGGAAAAAGESLPGKLAIARRSFEDVSQAVVEGLLPLVLPGLTSIGSTITTKVIPAITGFIQGFKDGEGPGGKFRDILARVSDVAGDVYDTFQTRVMPVLRDVGGFITGTVVPSVQSFIAEFQAGEGAGGTFRTMLEGLWNNVLVPLAGFVTGTLVPAIGTIAAWIRDTGVPALISFKDWVGKNTTTVKIIAAAITGVLLPGLIHWGVQSTISGAKSVAAWFKTETSAIRAGVAHVKSGYLIVASWVRSAAAAVASGAQTVAIWAMYKIEAVKGAASTVAAHARMAAAWVASKVQAGLSAAAAAGAWVASSARTVGAFALQTAAQIGSRAVMIASVAVIGIVTAAQWLWNAAMSANPIGIVILAIVALIAAVVWAWNNCETFRNVVTAVWTGIQTVVMAVVNWFTTAIPAAWEWIKTATSTAWNWIKDNLKTIIEAIIVVITGPIGLLAVLIFENWDRIKAATITAWTAISGFLAGLWATITGAVSTAWNAILAFFSGVVTSIRGFFQGVWNFLVTVFSYTPLGLIVNNWDAIVGFFTGLPGKIGDAVAGMWDGITGSFKDALNTVIRWWNDFSLDLRIPSNSVTDFLHLSGAGFSVDTPNIPYLASGALVTNPALAMLGESGHEAVLPFSRVDEFAGMVARQMGQMDLGPVGRRAGGRDLIDYDRLAAAMSNVNLTMDGRRVSQSADSWIGGKIR